MEEKKNKKYDYFHPIPTNTLGIPQEHDLLIAYAVYRPSLATRKLKSEKGRTIYAEYFIEDIKLGPLRDLCTRALATAYTPEQIPSLAEDPLQLRMYYDTLSLDLPLEECYHITDQQYWRRFVLAKNKDMTLAFKKEYDWRNLGLSMKFVELVESCPAEYWPEDEMQPIAMKIKDYINEMHIRNLQSMSERFFEARLHLDSDGSDSDSTDVESFAVTPRSPRSTSDTSHSDEEGEVSKRNTITDVEPEVVIEIYKTEEELTWERFHEDVMAERKERTRILREAQEKRRAEREVRWRTKVERKTRSALVVEQPKLGKKKKIFIPKGVLDIVVEDDGEDDGENLIVDRRNVARKLKALKMLTYPIRLCHHVSLRFLRFFENLTNFTIEFRGPPMGRDFHERHLKFSYADIEGLAYGLSFLQNLKIFRLRSSQMDAQKLYTLARALKRLSSIEIIDLGYDDLDEDCGLGLYELFRGTNSIKSLELEHNFIGPRVMHFIAIGLSYYDGQLEYLGLGGNPLGADGLHELSSRVLGTQHITHLSLRSAQMTESAIKCCIANEFLKHLPLQSLDIRAMPMSQEAGVELLKVLQFNKTIMHMDARDCNLAEDLEFDIDMITKRNKFVVANPYLNDPTKTQEDVDAYIGRVKNPILLRAMNEVEKSAKCFKNRPREFEKDFSRWRPSMKAEQSVVDLEVKKSVTSLARWIPQEESYFSSDYSSIDSASTAFLRHYPFYYNPNHFTVEQFHEQVDLPGPSERYFYYNLSQTQRISRIT